MRLQKPPGYVLASIICSFGGFLFGIDTGIIGPVTVMEDFEGYVGRPSPTVHGLIVSSILIPAALSSCLAGRLADAQGRPRGIALGALLFGLIRRFGERLPGDGFQTILAELWMLDVV